MDRILANIRFRGNRCAPGLAAIDAVLHRIAFGQLARRCVHQRLGASGVGQAGLCRGLLLIRQCRRVRFIDRDLRRAARRCRFLAVICPRGGHDAVIILRPDIRIRGDIVICVCRAADCRTSTAAVCGVGIPLITERMTFQRLCSHADAFRSIAVLHRQILRLRTDRGRCGRICNSVRNRDAGIACRRAGNRHGRVIGSTGGYTIIGDIVKGGEIIAAVHRIGDGGHGTGQLALRHSRRRISSSVAATGEGDVAAGL